jgi:hypothetical protein
MRLHGNHSPTGPVYNGEHVRAFPNANCVPTEMGIDTGVIRLGCAQSVRVVVAVDADQSMNRCRIRRPSFIEIAAAVLDGDTRLFDH